MYEAKDKVFLVTGGAAGLGAGFTRAFLEEGAKHVAALDVDVANGKVLETELTAKFGKGKVKFHKCDVTSKDLSDVYENVLKEFGYIDVVINNAGIMNDSPRFYEREIAVNVMEPHFSRSGVRVITMCFGCTDTSLLHNTKFAGFDKETDDEDLIGQAVKQLPMQKPESAVKGVVHAFRKGASASIWLVSADRQAEDVTANVTKGYADMSQGVFD